MRVEALVIDADGHILEPPDLWETYLEAKYRSQAIRIKVGDNGYEYLEVAGKRATMTRAGALGTLGGMGKLLEIEEARRRREEFVTTGKAEQLRFRKPMPEDTYLKGAAFGTMDMRERIQLLDREGMAKAVLYPTLGLLWECETMDPDLSGAYCRAYNRWIADFCRESGGRLVPIAHISLGDPDQAARELQRAAKDGCKGAFVAPFTITRRPHGDLVHDRVFAAAQDCGLPLAIHPTIEPPAWGVFHRYDHFGCLRNVFPIGRVRSLSGIEGGGAGVWCRMDRIFSRSRRCDFHRHHDCADRAFEGEAFILL
jgi:hypothetical protein